MNNMNKQICNQYLNVVKVLLLLAITFFAFKAYWIASPLSCSVYRVKENIKNTFESQEIFSRGKPLPKFDSMPNRIPENVSGLDQNDMALIRKVQFEMLVPPSHEPYKFSTSLDKLKYQGQIGVPPVIDEYLKNKTDGFFIEAGAHDGEEYANTLLFELKRNWTGLLVEPGPSFARLLSRNRKAYQIKCALAGGPRATYISLAGKGAFGFVGNKTTAANGESVPSIPIYTILKALGNPVVDYFSLDTNYREVDVLKSIPWDLVEIKAISIEASDIYGKNNLKEITDYMESVGYKIFKNVHFDVILVK